MNRNLRLWEVDYNNRPVNEKAVEYLKAKAAAKAQRERVFTDRCLTAIYVAVSVLITVTMFYAAAYLKR